jgi:glucuronate isomerase
MYETLEHWKQYKQEKDLQTKIAKEFKLDKAIKEANNEEFDKWFNKLIKKNGTTKY